MTTLPTQDENDRTILRVRDEHVQSIHVLDQAAGSGERPWKLVPR
jgi:hypothetical protein